MKLNEKCLYNWGEVGTQVRNRHKSQKLSPLLHITSWDRQTDTKTTCRTLDLNLRPPQHLPPFIEHQVKIILFIKNPNGTIFRWFFFVKSTSSNLCWKQSSEKPQEKTLISFIVRGVNSFINFYHTESYKQIKFFVLHIIWSCWQIYHKFN